jgi:hypothetical protein
LLEIGREMRARLTKDLAPPSAAEIQQASRTLPPAEESRTLQAIAVPKASRATADQIRSQADNDATFEKIWAQHDNKDPALPRRIVLADVTRRDLASKELADAAFALEVGAISPVIESGDTCYILHLVSRNAHDSPAERRERARDAAVARKADAAVLAHVDRLRSEAIVRTLTDPARTVSNSAPPKEGTRIEFESLKMIRSFRTRVVPSTMTQKDADPRLSGRRTVFCTSDAEGWAEWHITAPEEGNFRLVLLAVRGGHHAQVQIAVDGKNLGRPLELHAASPQPSGPLTVGEVRLAAGPHVLRISVAGKHPSSTAYHFSLDAIDLIPAVPAVATTLTPPSAPDLVEIIRVSPERVVTGRAQKITVKARYSLDSVPKGIIRIGFNTADPKSYRMAASHPVQKGSGEVELSATVTPRHWGEGQRFMAYVNLSRDPHPPQWTPLTSHTKAIPISAPAD